MKFNKYDDPGHGWLKVPRSLLKKLGIKSQITSFSYMKGDDIFLEEDRDMSLFIDSMKEAGNTVEIKVFTMNKQSKIREYDSYVDYTPEQIEKIKQLRMRMIPHKNWGKSSLKKEVTNMELRITINLDNDAFQHGNMKEEVLNVLNQITQKIEFLGVPIYDDTQIKVNDTNGNPVGIIEVTED